MPRRPSACLLCPHASPLARPTPPHTLPTRTNHPRLDRRGRACRAAARLAGCASVRRGRATAHHYRRRGSKSELEGEKRNCRRWEVRRRARPAASSACMPVWPPAWPRAHVAHQGARVSQVAQQTLSMHRGKESRKRLGLHKRLRGLWIR